MSNRTKTVAALMRKQGAAEKDIDGYLPEFEALTDDVKDEVIGAFRRLGG